MKYLPIAVSILAPTLAGSAVADTGAATRTVVFDVAPFTPFTVGGEIFGVSLIEGEVVHARLDATFVVADPGDWSMSISFVGFPMGGAIGFSSELEGWSGTGTFSTVVESDALNGSLAVPPGEVFYPWFVQWAGGTSFVLPGGGVGVQPVDGFFEVLKLTLTLAACPEGDVDLPWADAGGALAGTQGVPVLSASGSLCASESGTLQLANALPGGTTNLVIGLSQIDQPFLGGLLVPSPDVIAFGLPISASGEMVVDFTWPRGTPSGFEFWLQHWFADPGAPHGFAASNGLRACTP